MRAEALRSILAALCLLATLDTVHSSSGSTSEGNNDGHSSTAIASESSSCQCCTSDGLQGSSSLDQSSGSDDHDSDDSDHGSSSDGHGSSAHGSGHGSAESCDGDEHHRRLGGDGPWWCRHVEYIFVECFMVSSLIVLAISFEFAEHGLEHFIQHDFICLRYLRKIVTGTLEFQRSVRIEVPVKQMFAPFQFIRGADSLESTNLSQRSPSSEKSSKLQKNHTKMASQHTISMTSHSHSHDEELDLDSKQPKLSQKLLSRAAAELSVLGFIAFVIWSVRTAGWFDWLGEVLPDETEDGWRLPRTGSDIVHMLEDVHVHLFLAMIFFYSLILHPARSCDFTFDLWHDMEEEAKVREREANEGKETSHHDMGKGFLLYCHLRSTTKTYMQANSLLLFGAEDLPLDEFNFATYMQVNARIDLEDLIDFNIRTWAIILAIVMGIVCPMVRVADSTNNSLLSFNQWLLITLLMLVGVAVYYMRSRMIKIERKLQKTAPQVVDSGDSHMPPAPACPPPAESAPAPPVTGPPMDKGCADAAQEAGASEKHRPHLAPHGMPDSSSGNAHEGDHKHIHKAAKDHRPNLKQVAHDMVLRPDQLVELLDKNFNTELWLMRLLQVLLMIISYGMCETIGSKYFWSNKLSITCLLIGLAFVLHCFMWWVAASIIPWYMAVMTAPPNMDPDNLELAITVLNHTLGQKAAAQSREQVLKEYMQGLSSSPTNIQSGEVQMS